MFQPLENVRVLDFTHLLPGELCSTILSDTGCQVTRVERLKPGLGQNMPPVVSGESLYYWSLHRNKQRIAVNLKTEQGIKIVERLVKEVDVVLENFRPGVMDRLGLDYDRLKKLNPGLIYCSISGYGHKSNWAQKPGHDLNFIAESGVLALTRRAGSPPVMPGVLVSDYMAALYATLAVVSSLYEKAKSGKGKKLDVSMFECALSTQNILATNLLYTGQAPDVNHLAYNNELPNYNIYECSDGRFLAVASLERKFWNIFCQKIKRPDLIDRYPMAPDQPMQDEIAAIIKSRTLSDWVDIFEGSDCCVSPVNSLDEALQSPPAKEGSVVSYLDHPVLGKVPQLSSPISASQTGDEDHQAGHDRIGQTRQVLEDLGFSDEEVKSLATAGVIE